MDPRTYVAVLLGLSVLLVAAGCGQEKDVATTGQQYVYTVREGDSSLRQIAQRVYGTDQHVSLIEKANPAVKGQALKPGTKLVIPPMMTPEGQVVAPKECDRRPVY